MKKSTGLSILFIFSLVMTINWSYAQVALNIPIKEVPKKVLKTFSEKHPGISDASWYPYPNRYQKSSQATVPTYFSAFWDNNIPDYYEVKFTDEKGRVRKVYDRAGVWQVTSRLLSEDDVPYQINAQLEEKGYNTWSKASIERIAKAGEEGRLYKIWLTKENKKRILFFDDAGQIVKVLKSDDDRPYPDKNAKLKSAPGVSKAKRKIVEEEVPEKVIVKVKKNHTDVEIIEWVEHTRIYDPFQNPYGNVYYDLITPKFYEVIFSDSGEKYRAIYNPLGELLEIAQVLKSKNLPEPIKKVMKSDTYKLWAFSKEHDMVEIDENQIVYRIYGSLNNEPKLLILDDEGNVTE